jgi:hypothetical protein
MADGALFHLMWAMVEMVCREIVRAGNSRVLNLNLFKALGWLLARSILEVE